MNKSKVNVNLIHNADDMHVKKIPPFYLFIDLIHLNLRDKNIFNGESNDKEII